MIATCLFLLFIVVQGQAESCKDSSPHCTAWKTNGYCTAATYVSYMRTNCPKKCGFCSATCSDLKPSGHCRARQSYCPKTHGYFSYMKVNCKRTCNICPVNGRFSKWTSFTSCTKSCGGGTQTRSRTCTKPQPSNGGNNCVGPGTESKKCNTEPCKPVNGRFSKWSSFTSCTKSCGGGTQTRSRTCTKPRPSNGGNNCVGSGTESKKCNKEPCKPETKSCKDKMPVGDCNSWKSAKYCDGGQFLGFMKDKCQKTCGFCPPTVIPPTTKKPDTTKVVKGGKKTCGQKTKKKDGRVVGGVPATKNSWPWQVGINKFGTFFCGGTLIHPQWVLTATHCMHRREDMVEHITVTLGDHDRETVEDTEIVYPAAKIFNHPKYSRAKIINDIALIKLKETVKLVDGSIAIACLPEQGQDVPVGTNCYITGWGKIEHPGSSVNILQEAKMPVVSNYTCNKQNSDWGGDRITRQMVCAGYGKGSKISGCHGDSGGPFVCYNRKEKSWFVQGAVSWGSSKCDADHKYTVFARVSEFRNWIDETIKNN